MRATRTCRYIAPGAIRSYRSMHSVRHDRDSRAMAWQGSRQNLSPLEACQPVPQPAGRTRSLHCPKASQWPVLGTIQRSTSSGYATQLSIHGSRRRGWSMQPIKAHRATVKVVASSRSRKRATAWNSATVTQRHPVMPATQNAPNWAVKRTPTRPMASPFSWALLVPSALSGSGAAYLGR